MGSRLAGRARGKRFRPLRQAGARHQFDGDGRPCAFDLLSVLVDRVALGIAGGHDRRDPREQNADDQEPDEETLHDFPSKESNTRIQGVLTFAVATATAFWTSSRR